MNVKLKILLTNKFLTPLFDLVSPYFNVINYWEIKNNNKNLIKGMEIKGVISSGWDAIDNNFIKLFPNLEIIANMAAGVDNIDLEAANRNNIIVTNTPEIVTDDTADLAIGMILVLARNILNNDKYVRSSYWGKKECPLGMSLKNKKVGIAGLGRIGSEIAKRCRTFNLKIFYWGRKQKTTPYVFIDNLVELAKEVDFLVISCTGNNETRNLINKEVLHALGENSFLINVSRGFIVNQNDLIYALQNKIIAGAGLDVFESEPYVPEHLFEMANVILQPHVGSATHESRTEMYELTANNILSYFNKGYALTPVN